ncbi:MAG: M15 family metallopeptidase [Oculatellaceae cyanobacterium Prado106]|nr:M15 family metallopeptidase [Oculatellaceae cyanobacterium Prado106]
MNSSSGHLRQWIFFLLFLVLGMALIRLDLKITITENPEPQGNSSRAVAASTPTAAIASPLASPQAAAVQPPNSSLNSPSNSSSSNAPVYETAAAPPVPVPAIAPPPANPAPVTAPSSAIDTGVAIAAIPEANSRYGHFAYAEASPGELVEVGQYQGRSEYLQYEAADAYLQMAQAAQQEGIELVPISGFRDVALQADLFTAQTARRGSEAAAARISAPPGHSEHHTGYAIDIGDAAYPETDVETSFAQTPAFAWLQRNASRFGFEMSFTEGNAQGVSYEPWHWRFVVSPRASQVFSQAR